MNPSIESSPVAAPTSSRPVAMTLAFAGSLAVAATVWGYLFLNGHLRLPAWQVVVVPAAFIGWSAATGGRRWSSLLIVLLALGATTIAGLGEWFHFAGGLRANLRSAADSSQAVAIQAAIRSQIANHQQNAKQAAEPEQTASPPSKQQALSKDLPSADVPTDLPETTSASPAPAATTPSTSSDETPATPAADRPTPDASLTLQLAGKLYLDRLSTYWQGLALSLLLAWFATFQAARMTLQRQLP